MNRSIAVTALAALAFVFAVAACASPGGGSTPGELELCDEAAFAIGTDFEVVEVASVDPDSFNVVLADAQSRSEEWASSFVQIGLRFADCSDQGRSQEVSVIVPGEWEPGRSLRFARVAVFDGGWLDDSVSGERHVIWITSDDSGRLVIRRALRAWLCSRPGRAFWSSKPCP